MTQPLWAHLSGLRAPNNPRKQDTQMGHLQVVSTSGLSIRHSLHLWPEFENLNPSICWLYRWIHLWLFVIIFMYSIYIQYFDFCLRTEILELKVHRAIVRRDFSLNVFQLIFFENQVSQKEESCWGTSGTLHPNIPGFQCTVVLMFLCKTLLFSTLCSQISKDFVWKSKGGDPLISLKFCQATLSHNLRCKD